MHADFLESQELGVKHVNGVGHASMYYKFPHFQTSIQLPQCSSHDLLEVWHFRLWSFQGRHTKLERFLAKNQLYSNEIAKF